MVRENMAVEDKKESVHPITQREGKNPCNTPVSSGVGQVLCPCGCGFFTPKRPDQKHATPLCRFRVRNRLRYERQKRTLELAREIETMAQKALALAQSVLGSESGK